MDFKLIEYNDSLADKVADMWINSKEGWNGQIMFDSAEAVVREEKSSSSLKLWLAIIDDEVAGYCRISKYAAEEAIYVGLINVRTEYKGRKIGKKLLLKAIEEARVLGSSRIDLHTWPGNIAAVPLYKKCGFMWEKSSRGTHLFNLIPGLLKTELFEDFFAEVDWYTDNSREIKVEPDELKNGDMKYFVYRWDKDEKFLELEINKFGRSIHAIKTNDYMVRLNINNPVCVIGSTNTFSIDITNSSARPVDIEIESIPSDSLKCSFSEKTGVEDKVSLSGEFYVNQTENEDMGFDVFKKLEFNIKINGKSVVLSMGIKRKFAATFSFEGAKSVHHYDDKCSGYISVYNPGKQEMNCTFTLPDTKFIRFSDDEMSINIPAESYYIAKCNYEVVKGGYEVLYFPVKAVYTDGKETSFEGILELSIKTLTDCSSGTNRYTHFALTGQLRSYLSIENRKNIFEVQSSIANQYIRMNQPALGLPYSDEFQNILPESVEIKEIPGCTEWKIVYQSNAYENVSLIRRLRVYVSCWAEQSWTVINKGSSSYKNLHIKDEFITKKFSAIPVDGKVLISNDEECIQLENLENNRISSNWLFCKKEKGSTGIAWDPDKSIEFADWYVTMHQTVDELKPGESVNLSSFRYYFNIFYNYKEFSNFISGERFKLQEICLQDFLPEMKHPVISGNTIEFGLTVPVLSPGKAVIKLDNRQICEIELDEKVNTCDFIPELNKPGLLTTEFKKSDTTYTNSYLMLPYLNKEIAKKAEGNKLTVNNGCLEFKVDSDFAPVIHSCKHNGKEWIDSSYPKLGPKGWDNPWSGGFVAMPAGFRISHLLEQNNSAELCELKDSRGIKWEGIKVTTNFKDDSDYRKMSMETFYLTLPEMPVIIQLCRFVASRYNRGHNRFVLGSLDLSNNNGDFEFSTGTTKVDSFNYSTRFDTNDLIKISHTNSETKAFYYSVNDEAYPYVMKDMISLNAGRSYHEIEPDSKLSKVLSVLFFSVLDLKKEDFSLFKNLEFFMQ